MKEKFSRNISLRSLQEGAVQCNAVKVKPVQSSALQYKCTEQEYYRSKLSIKVFKIFSTVQFSAVYCSAVHGSAV